MNEHDSLEEALADFRRTLPSAAVRDSNRAAVRAALEPVARPIPWWRRSISLPVPVALATAAALLISVGTHLVPAGNNAGPSQPGLPVVPSAKGGGSGSALMAKAEPHIEYFETQRYLSGIGVIDREVFYQYQE